jgi:uncharacterized membrane protein
MQPEVKLGEWIQKAFDLYKANFGIIFPAALIAICLSVVSIGVLAGPMMAGMFGIIYALVNKQEPKPVIGDLFKGFSFFLPAFLLFLVCYGAVAVISLIPCIGWTISPLLSLGVGTAVIFAIPLIVDKKMDFWPAVMASFNKIKPNFWMFLAYYLVVGLISGVGMIACGIGVLVTAPFSMIAVAVAYKDTFVEGQPTETPQAPVA